MQQVKDQEKTFSETEIFREKASKPANKQKP